MSFSQTTVKVCVPRGVFDPFKDITSPVKNIPQLTSRTDSESGWNHLYLESYGSPVIVVHVVVFNDVCPSYQICCIG